MLSEDIVVVAIESHIVFFDVGEEIVSAENLGDLDKLIEVILALEEWLLLEDHTGEHATKGPDVEGVVVSLQVDQKLWALEVPGGDSHVVLLLGMIKFSETPIDKSKPLVVMVDHDVVWLHISMHDTLGVAVVESLEDLVDIESNIVVSERLVESPEINIASVDILHDECWSLGHRIADNINQVDDIDATSKSLQNLDFTSDLRLFDWLKDLDDNPLVVKGVDTLIDLGVFSTANLLDDLVVFLGPK